MATEVIHIIDPSNAPGTDYTSLSAWESAQRRNLVSLDEIAIAECRGGRDAVFGAWYINSGWTTGPNNYIIVRNHSSEQNLGYFDSNKYYLDYNNSSDVIQIELANFHIEGIQIKNSSSTVATCLSFFEASGLGAVDWRFNNCFFWNLQGNISVGFGAVRTAGGSITALNNMICSTTASSNGIFLNDNYGNQTNLYIANNSIYTDSYGIRVYQNLGGFNNQYFRNNIVGDASTPYYPLEGTVSRWVDNDDNNDYNFNTDTDNCNVLGSHGAGSATINFTNTTNANLIPLSTSTSILKMGQNLNNFSSYPQFVKDILSKDIAGNSRGSYWDAGAYQFSKSKNKYYMML